MEVKKEYSKWRGKKGIDMEEEPEAQFCYNVC